MNDLIIGQYLSNVFQGTTVNITFQQTLLPNAQGTFTIVDAENSSSLQSKIGSVGDIYLLDCFSYADPGFVEITLLPDGEASRQTKIDAHKNSARIPFPIPILIAVDIALLYTNEAVANNVYVNLTGIAFSQTNSLLFQDWCTNFMDALRAGGQSAGGQSQSQSGSMPSYIGQGQTTAEKTRCKRTRQ